MKEGSTLTYQIPWDNEHGEMSETARIWRGGKYVEPGWRDNFEFRATLEVQAIYWRDSSAVALTDETGAKYNMFITDFEKAILAGVNVIDGKMTSSWTFIKRGSHYGVRSMEAPK